MYEVLSKFEIDIYIAESCIIRGFCLFLVKERIMRKLESSLMPS